MTLRQHAAASAALAAISLNLLFWCIPLLALYAARLAVPAATPTMRRLCAGIYRAAVVFNDWWLTRISRAAWRIPRLDLDPNASCLVVANHRSWADVFLLQSAIARRGPILKFLCKRQLAYIPVLGLIMLAFDFPILRRRASSAASEPQRRQDDRRRVAEACKVLLEAPAAMLTFAEGTRFSDAKRRREASRHQHLLPARVGGFAAVLEALRAQNAPVVDMTIAYPGPVSFWQFLGGAAPCIELIGEQFEAGDIAPGEVRPWLEERWRRKDAELARRANRQR